MTTADRVRWDDSVVALVRAEYREMPGLSLTAAQASRLWAIEHSVCERVLRLLVLEGALYRTSRGTYVATPPMREPFEAQTVTRSQI